MATKANVRLSDIRLQRQSLAAHICLHEWYAERLYLYKARFVDVLRCILRKYTEVKVRLNRPLAKYRFSAVAYLKHVGPPSGVRDLVDEPLLAKSQAARSSVTFDELVS